MRPLVVASKRSERSNLVYIIGLLRRLCLLAMTGILMALLLDIPSSALAGPSGLQDYFANFSSKYFSVDLSSGTAQTSVPVLVPQGRKGIAPNLALSYSSASRNGWCGVGWNLDMGSIERSTKKGIPKYRDADDAFQMSFQGSSSELVNTGANEFRLKIESAFMRVRQSGTGWEVADKTGTRYLFGSATGVETNALGTFKWLLDKVIDAHGNTMKITYQNDGGFTYLSRIDYVGNDITGDAPTHSVEFVLEDKPDWTVSFAGGTRVENRRRLKEIVIRVRGALARRYRLEYTQSATSGRSLLTRVVQYGSDEASTMPTVTFTYDDRWHGWEQNEKFNCPDGVYTADNARDQGRRLADVNGDGLTDLLVGKSDKNNWIVRAYKNTGEGWEEDPGWKLRDGNFVYERLNDGRRLADVNGDGLIDVMIANKWDSGQHKAVNLNSGSGWLANDARFVLPDGYFVEKGVDQGRQLADVNGDGFADVLVAKDGYKAAYINTGSGWDRQDKWNIPDGDFISEFYDQGRVLADVNGDGLTDLLIGKDDYRNCYLNNGNGWVEDKSWAIPEGSFVAGNKQQGLVTVDLNKDGLVDLVSFKDWKQKIWWNNGHGWTQVSSEVAMPEAANFVRSSTGEDQGVRVVDINGDGAVDISIAAEGEAPKTYVSLGATQDLLTGIQNGIGGKVSLEYTPSTKYDNSGNDGHPHLPFPIMTVSRVVQEDGLGNSYVSEYLYVWGMYDYPNREFRGFGQVNVKDADGNLNKNWFHQDDARKGKQYMQEFFDSAGDLLSRTWNEWQVVEYNGGRVKFARNVETRNHLFERGGQKITRATYRYDDYGNVTQVHNKGEEGNSAGSHQIFTEYAYDTANWVVGLPVKTYVLDENGQKISEQAFVYSGTDLIEKRAWLSGGAEVVLRYAYDGYGNAVRSTDPLGRVSRVEYDATFHAFPVKTINVLGHVQTAAYDPLSGQVLSSTDANGVSTATRYDVFGRPVKVIGPNASDSLPSTTYSYDLSARPLKTTVRVNQLNARSAYATSHTFFDGMGRQIQTLTEADAPGVLTVSGSVAFNNRGLVEREWLPYEMSGQAGAEFAGADLGSAHNTYEYDALGRVISVTRPDGVQLTSAYNFWTVTSTDANGNQKTTVKDAFGRVVEIIEEGINAKTRYGYNARGDLIRVQDAQGNVSTMTYDSLGRKTGMNDPDMGRWTYSYDAAGNLISQTDAKNQTTTFTYDAANRITRKTYASGAFVQYTYDDPKVPYSKGRLTKVQDASGTAEFFYDNEGREIRSVKTVDGTPYTIERRYDALGRIVSVTYPDGEVVNTAYTKAGGIQSVTGKDKYVQSMLYTARGQLSQAVYGNGTKTDYTYNPNTQYLEHLVTTGPPAAVTLSQAKGLAFSSNASRILQDLSYRFDNAGNILNIDDRVYTATQSFQYDALNRLTGATGAYGRHVYAYDAIGNMTSKNGIGYVYGSSRPHAVTRTSAGFEAEYDANGNMTRRKDGSTLNQLLEYDEENRLARVTNLATKATIRLEPGWNLFSLPLLPADTRITSVLKGYQFGRDYDQVSRFDAASQTWQHWVNNAAYNQFDSLEYGRGYEIYVSNPNGLVLEIQGNVPAARNRIGVRPGWNLIGAPVLKETSVDEALKGLARDDYSSLMRYSPATDSYDRFENQEFSSITPGAAYFIRASKAGSISPTNLSLETRFVYDGDGGRVKKIADGVETIYIGKIYEVTKFLGATNQATKHIFAGSNRVCTVTDTGSKAYYHPDHLGSASVITAAAGQLAQVVEYTPFGETSKNQRFGPVDVKHKFTGQEIDNETGLYFYNARYYDPQLCRFITADIYVQRPSDPQTLNRYTYTRNNPLIYIDESGHFFGFIFAAIFSIIKAAVIGAAVGAVVSAATGGNVVDGVVTGAITGAIFNVVGGLNLQGLAHTAAHFGAGAGSGAINASISGNDPGLGALIGGASAGSSEWLGSNVGFLKPVPGKGAGAYINNVSRRAAIGGLTGGGTSAMLGGNFWSGARQGALTAGIAYSTNDWMHDNLVEPLGKIPAVSNIADRVNYEWEQYWGNRNFWNSWGRNLPDIGVSATFHGWNASLTYKTGLNLVGANNALLGASFDIYSTKPGYAEVGVGVGKHASVGYNFHKDGSNDLAVHLGKSWPPTIFTASGAMNE